MPTAPTQQKNPAAFSKKAAGLKPARAQVDPFAVLADPSATRELIVNRVKRDLTPKHRTQLEKSHNDDPFGDLKIQTGDVYTLELITPGPDAAPGSTPVLLETHKLEQLTMVEHKIAPTEIIVIRRLFWRDNYRLGWGQDLAPNLGDCPVGAPIPLTHTWDRQPDLFHNFDLLLGKHATLRAVTPLHKHFTGVLCDFRDRQRQAAGYNSHYEPNLRNLYQLGSEITRAKDITGLATILVGEKNIRTDLLKTLATAMPSWIVLARVLWDPSMPVDWFINFLNLAHQTTEKFLDYTEKRGALGNEYSGEYRKLSVEDRQEKMQQIRELEKEIDDHGMPNRLGWMNILDPMGVRDGLPPWLEHLDMQTRARLLKRPHTGKELKAMRDIAQAYTHRNNIDPDRTADEIPQVTSAKSWADLEYQLNARNKRVLDLKLAQKTAEEERLEALRADWYTTDAGAAWLAKRTAEQQAAAARQAKAHQKAMEKLKEQNLRWHDLYEEITQGLTEPESGLSYEFASTREQLTEWSRKMGNCISGYSPDVLNSGYILAAVHRKHRMIGNLEIRLPRDADMSPRIGQLEGPRQDRRMTVHRQMVLSDLSALGVQF